jgi:hypothetical protein
MVTYQANFLAETIDALCALAKGRAA